MASSYDQVLSTPIETKLTAIDLLMYMEPGATSDSLHSHLADSKATHTALKSKHMQAFLVSLYPGDFCLLYSRRDILVSFF